MAAKEQLVAVISPWEKLADLVKRKFRVESLPTEKKVMVWRDDLHDEPTLLQELKAVGITTFETRTHRITNWKDVD